MKNFTKAVLKDSFAFIVAKIINHFDMDFTMAIKILLIITISFKPSFKQNLYLIFIHKAFVLILTFSFAPPLV